MQNAIQTCNVSRLGRNIYLMDELNETTIHETIRLIREIEFEDDEMDNQMDDNNSISLATFEGLPDNEHKPALLKAYNDYFSKLDVENKQREPIFFWISSFGGCAYTTIDLLETMRLCKTPIWTYCIGKAMSGGFWVFACGDRRFMGQNATITYHQMSTGAYGTVQDIKESSEQNEKHQMLLESILLSVTNISEEQFDYIRLTKQDWYIEAEEALELGICDEII